MAPMYNVGIQVILNIIVFVLYMTVFFLNMTGLVLNMTEIVPNMTGFNFFSSTIWVLHNQVSWSYSRLEEIGKYGLG